MNYTLKVLSLASSVVFCSFEGPYAAIEHGKEDFDKPLRTTVISVKPDPYNPQNKATLTCTFYSKFFVKQTDLGEKGATRLAIASSAGKVELIPCKEGSFGKERIVYGDNKGWSGYFRGVKGNFIFFDGDDGLHGGMPFAVFDVMSGKMVFSDIVDGNFRKISASASALDLSYRRVYGAPCSLYHVKAGCWDAVMKDTGLSKSVGASCKAGYQKALADDLSRVKASQRTEQIKRFLEDPSVLTYEVTVNVTGGKTVREAQPGKSECYPAE